MRLSTFFLGLFLMTGLFSEAQSGITRVDSIYCGNVYRKFRLYVPAVYSQSKAAPLIVNLHGLSMTAITQQSYSDFMPVADTAGFLMVLPEGLSNNNNQFWNVGVLSSPDDVLFIKNLVDSISALYTIDQDMVYSCGLSNGGIMSYYLACQLPGKFAAIASVAGTMFRTWFFNCGPLNAVPVMEIHGTNDGTVPYAGNSVAGANGLYMPVDTVIDKWVRHNRCSVSPVITTLADINGSDFSIAQRYLYSGGIDGSTVELYKVIGGSHSWPGAIPVVNQTNQDFSATLEIWRFFRKYKRKQFNTNLGLGSYNASSDKVPAWPNPCNSVLNISKDGALVFQLTDLYGSVVCEGEAETLDVSGLSAGVYFLKISDGDRSVSYKIVKE